jgi:hypothetical protein
MAKTVIHANVRDNAQRAIVKASAPILGKPNLTQLIELFGNQLDGQLEKIQLSDGSIPDCELKVQLVPRKK